MLYYIVVFLLNIDQSTTYISRSWCSKILKFLGRRFFINTDMEIVLQKYIQIQKKILHGYYFEFPYSWQYPFIGPWIIFTSSFFLNVQLQYFSGI